ncbi:cathelicidin-related antimicrobial peptide Na_CRAMP-like isoform X1 [Rana temporaria]|uniref:cathelicidin-related antimicrobial peptide Na_CRAMP-like isoform X1 n=1 Tax=Rana temporaria TaxID=8407 RepID=UPI001AADDAA0|nr:cathelicidin-related antimicrobial peptide Na_CRAMP-like isoform X1 [Rana temporaria]XP_040211150.1 cathelicidin-related antimicrobial peptide Na_CRAMP-like isoform X1 [Rana temporaria]
MCEEPPRILSSVLLETGRLSSMTLSATLWFLMGLAAGTTALPLLQWSEDDVAVMALYSADHYNKVSGEDALYGLLENGTEYITDEKSRFHQLSFPIQETVCQKGDNALMTDDCAFKEGGVVKLCTSYFFEEDDRDIVVVNCQSQDGHREHSRVRRSRSSRGGGGRGGRGGSGGRGGRGGGRSGSRSSIAGGGTRGGSRGGGGTHYA